MASNPFNFDIPAGLFAPWRPGASSSSSKTRPVVAGLAPPQNSPYLLQDAFNTPRCSSSSYSSWTSSASGSSPSPSPPRAASRTMDAIGSAPTLPSFAAVVSSTRTPLPPPVPDGRCQWNGCNAPLSAATFNAHVSAAHPGEVVDSNTAARPCRWRGCAHGAPLKLLRRHVRHHAGLDETRCAACGDVYARRDAALRHRTRGGCVVCAWCRTRFGTVEEKVAHVRGGCAKGDVAKAGRPPMAGKKVAGLY
jgi:hypothetical protein